MAETKHSTLPWKKENSRIRGSNNEIIAYAMSLASSHGNPTHRISSPKREANAEFIARACNAHDELLEACRLAAIHCDDYSDGAPDALPHDRDCNRLGEILETAIFNAT